MPMQISVTTVLISAKVPFCVMQLLLVNICKGGHSDLKASASLLKSLKEKILLQKELLLWERIFSPGE